MKTHTPEQTTALSEFDLAVDSSDLRALGYKRRQGACRHLVECYNRVKDLGLEDALTDKEKGEVQRAIAHLG